MVGRSGEQDRQNADYEAEYVFHRNSTYLQSDTSERTYIRQVKYEYLFQQHEQSDLLNKYRLNVNGVLNVVYLMIALILSDPVQII
jgi:hypothetical protein